MKRTPRVLRTVALVGVATVAPLLAAMPASAGIGVPQGPDAADVDEWPPGPGAIGPEYVVDLPPGPGADIIVVV